MSYHGVPDNHKKSASGYNLMLHQNYENHQSKMLRVQPIVNTTSPFRGVEGSSKSTYIKKMRRTEINKDNQRMLKKIIGIMHQSPAEMHSNRLIREGSGRLMRHPRQALTPRSNTPRQNTSQRRFNSVMSRGSDTNAHVSV